MWPWRGWTTALRVANASMAPFSQDGGATWSKNVLLYESPGGTICQCCAPSLARAGARRVRGDVARRARGLTRLIHASSPRRQSGLSSHQTGHRHMEAGRFPDGWGGLAQQTVTSSAHGGASTISSLLRLEVPRRSSAPGRTSPSRRTAGKLMRFRLRQWHTTAPPRCHRAGADFGGGAYPAIVALPDGSLLAAWEENGSIAMHRVER